MKLEARLEVSTWLDFGWIAKKVSLSYDSYLKRDRII